MFLTRSLFIAALCVSTAAQGGGYYFGDSGIVAASRGGAWVAGADSQFAQLYNPAGIARVDAPTINLGMSAVYQGVEFTRLDQAGNPLPVVTNQAGPFPVPQMGFAMPVGEKFGFAFGGYSPMAADITFTEDGAQRYTLIDSSIFTYAFGATVAWQPVPAFSVGAGVSWQIFRAAERLKVSTSLFPNSDGSDRPEDDVMVQIDTWDVGTPGFNLGILVEPTPWMSIGLSLTPPTRFKSVGSASLDFTGHSLESVVSQVVIDDDRVALNIDLPLIFRWGIAIRPWEHTEIELAGNYETWSSLQDILVEDIDVSIGLGSASVDVPSEIALPAGFRDSYSLRLGMESQVHDHVAVRSGIAWERSALTPQNVSASLVDTSKVYIATGAGFSVLKDRLLIDVGAGWMFYEDLEIRDSAVKNINVVSEDSAYVVGNGDLTSHGWVLSTQLSYRFGNGASK